MTRCSWCYSLLSVSALSAAACADRPLSPPPELAEETSLSAPDGLFGINIDPSHGLGDPGGGVLNSIGAGMVRFTFKDETFGVEPDPSRLAHYQQKVAAYHAAGVRVLVLLSYETAPAFPAWSSDPVAWAEYRARFSARAGAIAAQLGDVDAYEIWNEPDEPNPRPEYAPNIPANIYGELLRDSWWAIKAVSGAQVIIGGLDSGDPSYLVAARNAVGALYADGVGVHPYGQRPDPNWPSSSWGFGNLEDLLWNYHTTTGLPVWITELGIEDQSIQAEYLSRAFVRVASLPGVVAHLIWFCWSDGMVHGFGIVDGSLNAKPAYFAFEEAAAQPEPEPEPDRPRIEGASFSSFTVPGDDAPTIRADIEVHVPSGVLTQPMGTAANSCAWYGPGESFRDSYVEIFGAWRVGIDVWGASSARDLSGVDHPWRFALRRDGCELNGANNVIGAESGRYTITGFFKLSPGDEPDPALYYAGLVQEGISWNDDYQR